MVTMNVPKSCIPGAGRVDGTVVYTCKSDGSGEVVTLSCPNGILDKSSGNWECKDIKTGEKATSTPQGTSTTDDSGIVSTPLIQKWYENPWFTIGLIITIISGLYYLSTKKK